MFCTKIKENDHCKGGGGEGKGDETAPPGKFSKLWYYVLVLDDCDQILIT